MPLLLAQWFCYFLFYSFGGWCAEILWCATIDKKLHSRGFLYGPLCPIYGFGALISLATYQAFQLPWWGNFLLIIIFSSVFEYFTSFLMEKIFHLRWWDYTKDTKFSLNGRISLETTIGFGLGGLFAIYIVQPSLVNLISKIPEHIIFPFAIIALIMLSIDFIISTVVSFKAKSVLTGGRIDRTPEIKRYAAKFFVIPRPILKRRKKS